MRMAQVWLVFRHEFLYNLTRRSYILTAFGVPLFILAIFFISIRLALPSESLNGYDRVGVVDLAEVIQAETNLNELNQDFGRYQSYENSQAAREAFNTGEISAYFLIHEDYLLTGRLDYYDQKGLPPALQSDFRDYLLANLVQLAPEGVASERLRDPANFKIQLLGQDSALEGTEAILGFVAPMMFGFLLVFNIVLSAQFLMMGVSEEKENRIMEILITSLRPLELITGKVFGLGLLSLLQLLILGAAILGFAALMGELQALLNVSLDPLLLGAALVYFFLFFFSFAGIMVGIGAATSAEQEARQFAGIFTALAIAPPMYAFPLIMDNPTGILATFMSLFPLTSPMTNLMLLGMGTASTTLIILSMIILALTMLFALWSAAKIFRAGMLLSGQRLSPKQIAKALREG